MFTQPNRRQKGIIVKFNLSVADKFNRANEHFVLLCVKYHNIAKGFKHMHVRK